MESGEWSRECLSSARTGLRLQGRRRHPLGRFRLPNDWPRRCRLQLVPDGKEAPTRRGFWESRAKNAWPGRLIEKGDTAEGRNAAMPSLNSRVDKVEHSVMRTVVVRLSINGSNDVDGRQHPPILERFDD